MFNKSTLYLLDYGVPYSFLLEMSHYLFDYGGNSANKKNLDSILISFRLLKLKILAEVMEIEE